MSIINVSGYYGNVDANQVAAEAANLRAGDNPSYTTDDFLSLYPQFGKDSQGNDIMPREVIDLYLELAHNTIKQARFRNSWKICMGLFLAHFCTLWLKSMSSPDDGADVVARGGDVQGIITSESVEGVSYSMDINAITQDLNGFAMWKGTQFGVQLASMAKLYGKAGIVVI